MPRLAIAAILAALVFTVSTPSCAWLKSVVNDTEDSPGCDSECKHDEQGEYDCTCK